MFLFVAFRNRRQQFSVPTHVVLGEGCAAADSVAQSQYITKQSRLAFLVFLLYC